MPETQVEELMELVVELKTNVQDMAKGKVDESTVDRIVQQAMAKSRQAGTKGFVPDDVAADALEDPLEALPQVGRFSRMSTIERFNHVLQSDAERIAPVLRKSADSIRAFQQASDELLLLAAMTKQRPQELDYFNDVYVPLRDQAMDTKTTGEGKELVAVELSTDLLTKLEGDMVVLALFPSINMPSNPFEFPVKGPRKHVAVMPEAIEPGTPKVKKLLPGTPSKVQLLATKFAGEIITSKELEEDAAIAILPFLQGELVEWLAWDLEDATLNGDATAPHMDLGVAADDPKTGWNGLRAIAKANGEEFAAGGPLTLNTALQTRAKMGRYGLSSAGIVWIVAVPSLYQLLAEDKLTTVDQYGAGATILSGEIGRLWGSPVIASDLIPTTCDATGVIAAAGTKTIAVAVNPAWFMHGVRRNTTIQVLTELYAESDQDAVMVTTRQAFTERYAGEPAVSVAINVDTTIPTLP